MKLSLCWLLFATLLSCGGREQDGVGGVAPASKPNVLLIVVDTLRQDHLTPYGYQQHETTPELQRLVDEDGAEVYFGAVASSSWTKPGVATLFTGLDPRQHGVMRLLGPGSQLRDEHTLAQEFSRADYATGCVMSNFLLSRKMGAGFERGFDFYDDRAANHPNPHRGSTAKEVVDSGLQWLKQRQPGQPWFLVLHFFDPHASFEDHPDVDWVDSDYQGWVVGGVSTDMLRQKEKSLSMADREALAAYYDEEIHAVDMQIGRLNRYLKEAQLGSQTVIVFTADHGEELGERKHIGHTQSLCAELVDLPLVVYVPPSLKSRWQLAESAAGGFAMKQIYPAILNVAALPIPEGRSLAAPEFLSMQVDFVPVRKDHLEKYVQKRAVRSHGIHYVLDTRTGEEWLYDLTQDPKMLHPLSSQHPGWSQMRALLGKAQWWEER